MRKILAMAALAILAACGNATAPALSADAVGHSRDGNGFGSGHVEGSGGLGSGHTEGGGGLGSGYDAGDGNGLGSGHFVVGGSTTTVMTDTVGRGENGLGSGH